MSGAKFDFLNCKLNSESCKDGRGDSEACAGWVALRGFFPSHASDARTDFSIQFSLGLYSRYSQAERTPRKPILRASTSQASTSQRSVCVLCTCGDLQNARSRGKYLAHLGACSRWGALISLRGRSLPCSGPARKGPPPSCLPCGDRRAPKTFSTLKFLVVDSIIRLRQSQVLTMLRTPRLGICLTVLGLPMV
jgi:hypothetical protein